MAIRKAFLRIGIGSKSSIASPLYIASIFIIGLLVPYTEPRLLTKESRPGKSTSPFVIAIQSAKPHSLPSAFNAVILITDLSVANSSIYGSSRVLNVMANVGLAPKTIFYVDMKGRPLRCFYLGLLAYLVELKEQAAVFFWLLTLCGLSSIISWTSIYITHLRFRKALAAENIHLEALPFRSPLGETGNWVGLICNIFIIIVQFLTALLAGMDCQHTTASLKKAT
ncbi:amino acid permease/ SLC12A domain-containing protein [Leptodontidium sp. MPI-SDFR-AT-0119]|nr:amino acid permease/ SLC12A domain-containing protein [Leptodontidium sp. MPI-SDFR-AT-0119]